MGILNLTPDSFSDGGRHLSRPVARVTELAAAGADIVDVGAESTRPGARPVPADEQLARLRPLLDALRERPAPISISIDTSAPEVALAALESGAVMVNDVRAGADPDLLPLVAERDAAVCLVHMQGTPGDMQDDPRYEDVVSEVEEFLVERAELAHSAGVAPGRVLVDPGIGFGKTLEHNLRLLAATDRFAAIGPVVIGVSRKGMLGRLLGRDVEERLPGSLAAAIAAVARGAAVVRVHDVRETADALRTWVAIRDAEPHG